MVAAGFLSRYLRGPLPYVRHHITVNKNVLSVLLNKIKYFLPYYRKEGLVYLKMHSTHIIYGYMAHTIAFILLKMAHEGLIQ